MTESRKKREWLRRLKEIPGRVKEHVRPFGTVHVGGLYVVAEERVMPPPTTRQVPR